MFSLHHIALSVSRIEQSIAFYQGFGFKPAYDWQAEDGSLRIAQLKLDSMLLDLFCFKEYRQAPDSSNELVSDLPRVGVKHFGLKVADIHQTLQSLKEEGLAEGVEVVKGRTGIDYFFIKDPDGILLEIVQDDRSLEG